MNKALRRLKEVGMNERFSAEAMKHAEYLHNKTITPILNMKTPQESLLGTAPNNEKIKTFRCADYTFTHKSRRATQWDNRADMGVYLGVANGLYWIYNPRKRLIAENRYY